MATILRALLVASGVRARRRGCPKRLRDPPRTSFRFQVEYGSFPQAMDRGPRMLHATQATRATQAIQTERPQGPDAT